MVMSMELEEKIKQVMEIVTRISEDPTIPRNVRKAASEAKSHLQKKNEDIVLRAASARMSLESVSDDPNMPVHGRTQIWSALSILETIR